MTQPAPTRPTGSGVFELASAFEDSLQAAARRRARALAPTRRPESIAPGGVSLRLIAVMQAIAAFEVDVTVSPVSDESIARRANMVTLNVLRALYAALTESPAELRQIVEMDAPRELDSFDRAHKQAVEKLAQMRAFAAMLAGENDDEELGIEVIPRADWEHCDPGSKSVPLVL